MVPMEKKRYFVSVTARTIMEKQGEAAYELEIEAAPEDIEKLQDLFDDESYSDQATFIRLHAPGVPYHHDQDNDAYDATLKEIYSMLYSLGTEETKNHISQMQILS